jgi:hypothetical protein
MPSCTRCGQTIVDPYSRCASCGHDTTALRTEDDGRFALSTDDTFSMDDTLSVDDGFSPDSVFPDDPPAARWPPAPDHETFAVPRTETVLVSAHVAAVSDAPGDRSEPAVDGDTAPAGAESTQEPPNVGVDAPMAAGQPPATPPGRSRTLVLGIAAAVIGGAVAVVMFVGSRPAPRADVRQTPEVEVQAASVVPAARAPLPAAAPRWSGENVGRWVGNNRRSIAFELPADNTVAVWMKRVRPLLVVRCLDRTTEVFVYTESAAAIEPQDDDHTVRLSFDDEPAETERWPDAAAHDALFAPDGEAFARRLARAGRLRFSFTPHNAAPVEARFELRGFDELVDPLARTCRWK